MDMSGERTDQQPLPEGIGSGKTNYKEEDVRVLQSVCARLNQGFDTSTELVNAWEQEEDVSKATDWVRQCFDINFNRLARSGGWRRYDPPSSLGNQKYRSSTDSIALLILFGSEISQEQVARAVEQGFFTSIKDNRPVSCKHTGVSLMYVRGFPMEVPSGVRCVIFKCWIRYVPKRK